MEGAKCSDSRKANHLAQRFGPILSKLPEIVRRVLVAAFTLQLGAVAESQLLSDDRWWVEQVSQSLRSSSL